MTDEQTQLYEGMFLFNIQAINGELQQAVDHLTQILGRAEAQVLAMSRWDERKLAYEIGGQKRGLFLLATFNARRAQVANIERDVNLSELLLRCLIIKGEHIGDVELQTAMDEAAKLADQVNLTAGNPEDQQPPMPVSVPDDADADADPNTDSDSGSDEQA